MQVSIISISIQVIFSLSLPELLIYLIQNDTNSKNVYKTQLGKNELYL